MQGVGFRPFVYRIAHELGLAGFVTNDPRGVVIEVEAEAPALERFLHLLRTRTPAQARVFEIWEAWLTRTGERGFRILASHDSGEREALVLPDLATCDACLREILTPGERRYGYPFTNCTDCGPRFSIIRSLPYDRPGTTMAGFRMCPECEQEYGDPGDRRFHAQPIACPSCGPALALLDACGAPLPAENDAEVIMAAAGALAAGRIVALKGLGGFHLLVDARNAEAVRRLRERKGRPSKPLALMAGTLGEARELVQVDDAAAVLLSGPESPIVLLPRRPETPIAADVAPGSDILGIMLPYTPLHHLLLEEAGFPVVATSGNRSEEPICTDRAGAVDRLGGIADLFVVHDRPIERHVDDSVAWIADGGPQLLRRARGYAPMPVPVATPLPTLLAVGGHLKNTVALGKGRQVFLSQHVGDLETPEAQHAFQRVVADLLRLYQAAPIAVAHDMHPDYASTSWVEARTASDDFAAPGGHGLELLRGLRKIPVQHHHAHLAACLAEHGSPGTALGIVWDGTGYGTDGTIWGGELLVGDAAGYRRAAHLRPFRLPGGDAAVREPRRAALALLWEVEAEAAMERTNLAPLASFTPAELRVLAAMLRNRIQSPVTTSAGRLFDAVAALIGLPGVVTWEGEAAVALELAADPAERGAYALAAFEDPEGGPTVLDWRPLLDDVLADLKRGVGADVISARFHNGLIAGLADTAGRVGEERVALTGGCFQNRRLLEGLTRTLRRRGHQVLVHRQVPANDGGIALGQVMVAAATLRTEGVIA